MNNAVKQPSTLEPFLPADHMRLNELVQHISAVDPKRIQFIQDMNNKREQYKYPKLTPGQRNFLTSLHEALVKQGLVYTVEA